MTNHDARQILKEREKNGQFMQGHAKKGGRKAGTPNAIAGDYAAALLAAGEGIGSDGNGEDGLQGYFMWLAVNRPQIFIRLLSKLISLEYLQKRVRDLERQLGYRR
jgi:hypothetical protein